ncbi:hypothetical protein A8924_0162 [Saccharopolyspora erythraea NRRL 2338]|nr:hypothetical protein A8924_0162 [Saccharopolyspora erythraea NRRL 2338]
MGAGRQRDRLSDGVLTERTGRGWDEWFALLDRWGAAGRTHREIAAHLSAEHGVDDWSAQSITVGYEQERGMRTAVTVSRTIAAGAAQVHRAFTDDRERRQWLADAPLRLRTATAPGSARFDWGERSRVSITIIAKDADKSSVHVEHHRLDSAEDVEPTREYWHARLDDLKSRLEYC